MGRDTTYLQLTVGRFRLALPTTAVVEVRQWDEDSPSGMGTIEGADEPAKLWVDLGEAHDPPSFPPGAGQPDPGTWGHGRLYTVLVETTQGPVGVAADSIDYVAHGDRPQVAVPRFGLREPDLFAGATRHGDHLLIVLLPESLAALARKERTII